MAQHLDVVEKAQEIYSEHSANLLSDHYDRGTGGRVPVSRIIGVSNNQ